MDDDLARACRRIIDNELEKGTLGDESIIDDGIAMVFAKLPQCAVAEIGEAIKGYFA